MRKEMAYDDGGDTRTERLHGIHRLQAQVAGDGVPEEDPEDPGLPEELQEEEEAGQGAGDGEQAGPAGERAAERHEQYGAGTPAGTGHAEHWLLSASCRTTVMVILS